MTTAEINKALESEQVLARELPQYAGEWVGVCDFQVVANAKTLGDLLERLETAGKEGVEVIQVPKDPSAACFF